MRRGAAVATPTKRIAATAFAPATPARRAVATVALAWATLILCGHIGDNSSHFRGEAGPWRVQVVVRHPGVVPGLADITVRVENGDAAAVSVRPVHTRVGLEGSPRPDPATPVEGAPGLWAAQLWFMEIGAYSVHVTVDGDRGTGTAIVPVNSLATRTLAMGSGLALVLIGLGLFLAVGLASIVRAAVAESTLAPGASPDPRRRRRARAAVGTAAVLLVLTVAGGRAWWNDEAAAYRSILFVPLTLDATVDAAAAVPTLDLVMADRNWLGQAMSPLVPDHGKLLHAFLVRTPDQDAFAHVHPEPNGDFRFRLVLPPLPAGRYVLYADVVHESGFTQTLTTEVDLPGEAAAACAPDCPSPDPDDAWWVRPAAAASGVVTFDDGTTLEWERPAAPIRAGEPVDLMLVARDAEGDPAALLPYMGMASHAAVRRSDGSVFVHLHPTGSISMAAQAQFARRAGVSGDDPHDGHVPIITDGRVSIPYAFPRDGAYRLWAQVKIGEMVRTAAWDVEVDP